MKVTVLIREGISRTHVHEDYVVFAEPNEHGDLVIYRDHKNMLTPQPVASYAAGNWLSHETS